MSKSESFNLESAAAMVYGKYLEENKSSLENGWNPKIGVDRVAARIAIGRYEDEGLSLDFNQVEPVIEMTKKSIDSDDSPVEPTEDQWKEIERLVDTIPCSYDEAYLRVLGRGAGESA